MLILRNDWLEKNKVEMSLIYKYDYDQSMLISSEKYGENNIQVLFYRLQHDTTSDGFFIKSKIRQETFKNRQEVERFLDTVRMFSSQTLH